MKKSLLFLNSILNVNDLLSPFQTIHVKLQSGKTHTDDECGTTETTEWIKAVREISEEQNMNKIEQHGDGGGQTKKTPATKVKGEFFFQGLKPLNASGILINNLNPNI